MMAFPCSQTSSPNPWSNEEVKTFLSLLSDERIQRELDGTVRNEKIFQGLALAMFTHGFERTSKQCREKIKKLKAEYRSIKDHNSMSGANRRQWKWFAEMDAIYGERPVSNGRESGVDTATPANTGPQDNDTTLEMCAYGNQDVPDTRDMDAGLSSADSRRSCSPSVSAPSVGSRPRYGKRKRGSTSVSPLLETLVESDAGFLETARRMNTLMEQQMEADAEDRRLDREERREERMAQQQFNDSFLDMLPSLLSAVEKSTK
ncbi:zinc finger and SCAN domain-containing protein 29-like [Nothobranchius furzeri]|uniref:zinc finger and SCAN domain-containing protein 29-like n=1 Tax=Nothobranchius furzeri TaxID=105023 RepID=UPI00390493F9